MRFGLTVTEFESLANDYPMVPVWAEAIADLETPMSMASRMQPCDCLFVLESAEQGLQVGRYSFICFDPLMVFESTGSNYLLVEGDVGNSGIARDPLATLREAMSAYASPSIDGLPPLLGGCVGYVGYDYVRFIERLPSFSEPDELPDILMAVPRCVLAFDHLRHTLVAVVNCKIGEHEPKALYHTAVSELRRLMAFCGANGSSSTRRDFTQSFEPRGKAADTYKRLNRSYLLNMTPGESSIDRKVFEESVRRVKQYIIDGDVFQVVLSRPISVPVQSSALTIYRALRSVNPSPYMFLLDFGHVKVIGASPEMLVKLQGREAEVRPIAGTRPRAQSPDEDRRLEIELLSDVKERAEHVMLVDLGRNDLGRVCVPGTVRVESLMHVERYSHVMHIVSAIKGELSSEYDQYDLFRATFPAGTVTGAPKVRAMEIIEEQEGRRRGVYAGAVGYFGASGNMDMCIAIRTMVMAGRLASVQAGAGIVADSDPAREYEEAVSKTRAILRALELADSGDLGSTGGEAVVSGNR